MLLQKKLDIHVDFGHLTQDFALHDHDYCELVFITDGTATHVVGETAYPIKKGDIFVLKGREIHGFCNVSNLKLYNVMFHVSDLLLDDCRDLSGFWVLFVHEQTNDFISRITLTGSDFDLVHTWCRQLMQEYTAHQPGYISVCHSILMQMIVFLSRICQHFESCETQPDFRLANAVTYMQTNFSEKINVEQLAAIAGFSPRHFSRLFQEVYQITPMQFLNEIRLGHARILLETRHYKVSEVAALCGFSDGNYFSKVFRQKYLLAPSEWK